MIHYLNPDVNYTDRTYLTQWFEHDILVITDTDLLNQDVEQRIANHPPLPRIIDITHNPFVSDNFQINFDLILSNNFDQYYNQSDNTVFFPLWFWMFSSRSPLWYDQFLCFDADTNKTKAVMCLNNNRRLHRTQLWEAFNKLGTIDQIVYTFSGPDDDKTYPYAWPLLLPDETEKQCRIDVGVGHSVYQDCAVNIVTESITTLPWLSEKVCKPFIAQQIPVIVACAGTNEFLKDLGLDMFEDVVPWLIWDRESNDAIRIDMIANFVDQWIRSGSIMSDYQKLIPRIEKNKQYFHSEKFRSLIIKQMDQLNFKPS